MYKIHLQIMIICFQPLNRLRFSLSIADLLLGIAFILHAIHEHYSHITLGCTECRYLDFYHLCIFSQGVRVLCILYFSQDS